MKRSLNRSAWITLALLGAAALSGCAGASRQKFLTETASKHVYKKPLEDVWEHARQLLREEGFGVKEAPGAFEMLTDEKEGNPSSLGMQYTRVYAKGQKLGADASTVQFMRHVRMTAGERGSSPGYGREEAGASKDASKTRDVELEWKLLQRVEPETAKRLEEEAAAKFK